MPCVAGSHWMSCHTWHILLFLDKNDWLLDVDSQVHSRMDGTIQFEGPCCIKWTDSSAIVADVGFVDRGSATFSGRFWCGAIPGAVRNNMR